MDEKVKGLNETFGQTKTAGGRVVALPQNPADRGSGLSSAEAIDRGRPYFEGEKGFIGPSRGPKPRMPFEGERDFVGPLPGPPETKERVTRAGQSASLDPYSYEGARGRLAREKAMLDRANATGDATLIADWGDRVARSQKAVDRLDQGQGGFGAMLNHALMRSRVNMGPLSPLMMDLAPMLGVGSAALGGLGALGALVQSGNAVTARANRAYYELGGSPQAVGQAISLGGENASAKAMDFHESLTRGTVGAAYMRSKGIQYRGRYTDLGSNYIAGIDALRGIGDDAERVRVARETGLTEDLWLSDLSESSYRRLKNSRAAAGSPERRRDMAESKAMSEEVGGWWDNTLQFLNDGKNGILMDLKAILWDIPAGLSGDKEGAQQQADGLDTLNRHWNPWYKEKPKKGGATSSPRWETGVEPVMGNGPQTFNGSIHEAIPVGWRGQAIQGVLENESWMLGAFHP